MGSVVIFDYDGTIHDTMRIYEPAFREAFDWLVREGYTRYQEISSAQIAGWLGLNSKEMWNSFLPGLPGRVKEEASRLVGAGMVKRIENRGALWYPGAEEMLDRLKTAGFTMLILSNCKAVYRKANWKEFKMERWFTRFFDCEAYGFAPKTEIIRAVAEKYPDICAVVGDRRGDMDCARTAGVKFIGCQYGFGTADELSGADDTVDSVREIADVILQMRGV